MVSLSASATDFNAPQQPDSLPQLSPVPLGWSSEDWIMARAHLVGERLVLKTLETTEALSTNPLIVRAGQSGCAVLLRYGVVVLFNLDKYELRERFLILEQKLTLISRSVETALGILQQDSSHRVEWYIVILIVVEILLSIYEIWLQ